MSDGGWWRTAVGNWPSLAAGVTGAGLAVGAAVVGQPELSLAAAGVSLVAAMATGRLHPRSRLVHDILDAAGEGLYATDALGRCRAVNDAAARMLGTSVDALVGRRVHELHHRREQDGGASCKVCAPLVTGARARGDEEFTRENGTSFPVEYTSTTISRGGDVIGIVTFNDISERKRSEEALRQSELKFRAVAESAPDAMVSGDASGRIVAWNSGARQIFGYREEEILGQSLTVLMPERFRAAHEHGMARFLATGQPKAIGTTVEVWGLRRGGEEFPLELSLAHWERDGNHFFTGILRDVTDRKRAEAALAREAGFLQLLHAITDAANRAIHSAEALEGAVRLICEHTGWPVGHACRIRSSSTPIVSAGIWHLADEERFTPFRTVSSAMHFLSGEGLPGRVLKTGRPAWIIDVTQDGNFPRWETARDLGLKSGFAFPVLIDQEVTAVLEFYTDEVLEQDEALTRIVGQVGTQLGRVVERERARQLEHQAMHDPLTSLPNRTLFLDRLAEALAATEELPNVAVLFLDLDRFKLVNDSLGHQAGDDLLVEVASRLRAALRPGDTVARLGGDEFTVLCPDVETEEEAAAVAQRVAEMLADPFIVEGNEIFITASIGIALAKAGDKAEDLLRGADAAVYQAKDGGRARYETFKQLNQVVRPKALHGLKTVNSLHRATHRNELRLHYQPQMALETGDVLGVEALVRWQHPEQGLLSPAQFIPLAEETGLIVSLGRWVLTEACRQAREWQQRFPLQPALAVGVNVSAHQFQHRGFLGDVAAILADTQVDPRAVVFEVTESVLLGDAEGTVETVRRLRDLGLRFALDDFGTGYSSLTYLRRLPVDILKIDRSFTAGLGVDPQESAMTGTIVRLARQLELQTVAEGVERREQADELRALGCEAAQGYYFARPVPAQELEDRLWQAELGAITDGAVKEPS